MDDLLKFNVSMYEKPPLGHVEIFQQVDMAAERLKIYKIFRSQEELTVEELKTELDSPLKLLLEINSEDAMKARRMDFIGHWTLRIAYSNCHPSFFIKNELRWFKMRFNNMLIEEKREFVENNVKSLFQPSEAEMIQFELEGKWYKVDFRQVTSLVRHRLCPMSAGYAFVPEEKIVFLLLDQLEKHLKSAVIHAKQMLPASCEQLKFILSSLDLVKPWQSLNKNVLELADLEKSVTHFPLCMKFQHETLKMKHHLKHKSRYQYGLFLKGIGLSLDDALQMLENEFTKKMTKVQFTKKYSYYFKHLYGTVGAKTDYKLPNCDKIQYTGPSHPEDVNGCPFKHWNIRNLTKKLKEAGVSQDKIEVILVLKEQSRFKEACTKCFECLHNCKSEIIDHPVEYYEKSCSMGDVDIEDLYRSDSD